MKCDMCYTDKENWYEEDEGRIVCGDCRNTILDKINGRYATH